MMLSKLFLYLFITLSVLGCTSCARRPSESLVRQKEEGVAGISGVSGKRLIVIDPGHGGQDFGTKTITKPYLYEKTLTLKTAQLVCNYLNDWGYTARLTRKSDIFVPLLTRARLANESGCGLFVSIHYNSAPNKQASGVEVYYYPDTKNKKRAQTSELVARRVLERMCKTLKSRSRGVRAGDFAVIRETAMPAILVEAAFLTNNEEAKRLRNPLYVRKLSLSLAEGVRDFVERAGW